jgi:hypothetical protein
METLANIICLSLLAAFMILLITKLGIREWVQTFGSKLFAKLFSCDFCLSFWVSVILSVIFYTFVNRDLECIIYPLLATPIIRRLI